MRVSVAQAATSSLTTLTQVMEVRNALVQALPDLQWAVQTGPDRHASLSRLAHACRGLAEHAKEVLGEVYQSRKEGG